MTGSGERLIIHPFARLLERKVEVCDRRNSGVGSLGNARVVTLPLLPPPPARTNSAAQEFEASRTGTRLEQQRTALGTAVNSRLASGRSPFYLHLTTSRTRLA